MISFYDVFIKLGLGILCLTFQINLMGKGNLAPTSAMDQVQNYVLGGIIGGVIYNRSITTLEIFLVLIIWTLLIFGLKFIQIHNRYAKRLLDGRPVTLILNGNILTDECMKYGISANDLTFKLRSAGVYHISSLKRVVLEQNGQFTIVQIDEKDNIKYPLIADGQINEDVLELIQKDKEWVFEKLKESDFELSQVYIGEYISKKLIIYPYKTGKK